MAGNRTRYLRAGIVITAAMAVAACGAARGPAWTSAPAATMEAAAPAASRAATTGTDGTSTAAAAPSASTGAPGMPPMAGMSVPQPAATPATVAAAAPSASTGAAQPAATVVPDPNAPAPVRFDPIAPAVLPGTVHDVDMPIIDKDLVVAKGYVVHTWTFGGTVPGPTIRVHLGDTVRVHLTNRTNMSHSIDFHASQTAMNDQMVEIRPGMTWTYTFTADYAGVWMYHCGTAPALHHIANGMFGMVIVEPRGGFTPADTELAVVQSEWYLGAQGQPVDYAKADAAAPAPDFQVFNGVANQYKDEPIQINTGKRVRVFVLNVGPNLPTSFHVVGTVFDTVIKEGVVLARGNDGGWGSQAVDLSPAQGAVVEFQTAEDGMYVMVNHAFNFVGRGAIGALMSGDGDPNN